MKNEFMENQRSMSRILTPKRSYIAVLVCVFLWCLSIVVAPVLAEVNTGSRTLAGLIMLFYAPTCHQIAGRSFQIGGHALAVCSRCTGIYAGFLTGCIAYPLIRRLRPNWNTKKVLLWAITPMVIDFSVAKTGLYPSNTVLRAVTGLIAGGIVSVLLLPLITGMFNKNHG